MKQVQVLPDQKTLRSDGRMALPGRDDDGQLHSKCIDKAALPEEEEENVRTSVVICKSQELKNMKNFTSAELIERHQVQNDNEDCNESGNESASQVVKTLNKHASVDFSIDSYSSGPACLDDTVKCDGVKIKYQEANDKSGYTAVSSREPTRQIVALKIMDNQCVKCNSLFKWSLRIGILAKWFFPDSVMSIREHDFQSQDFYFVWDPGGFMWDPGGLCTLDPCGTSKYTKSVCQDFDVRVLLEKS